MRMFLAAALVAAAVAAFAHPLQTAPDEGSVRAELLAVRAAIQEAVAAKDVKRLQAIYTDSFTHTHGSGRVDGREARIVSLLAAEPVIELAPVGDLVVRVHGAHTATMHGTSPILNPKEQKYYDFRWIWVFVREAGGWRLAASQASRLPNPPRDKP